MFRAISSGTRGESVISKPWSPIRQDMASSQSSITVEPDATTRKSRREGLAAETPTSAAAPSAKSALATIRSEFQPYWWWRLHISTANSNTQAPGSCGEERPRHPQAVEQPVAAHEADVGASDVCWPSASCLMSAMSKPGA